MPRERSTWNVENIAKRAGMKVADPYTMNQDHQQPSADQYVIGGPSDFAEDVHPSNTTWESEYAGGQVKRNEIGMPEMRSDTFNHPEKTASEEVITKKAALCVAIARKVLPKTASAAEIEDQSFAFMYLPDAEVMSTYTRLAAQDDLEGDQSQQKQVQAAQQQGQDQQQGQQVQAGQIPPQFLENVKKKKEEAADKKDDEGEKKEDKKAADQDQVQQDQGQQKQAQQDQDQVQQDQGQQKQAQQDQGQQDQVQDKQAAMQQQLAQLIQQAQQIQQQLAQGQQQTQQPVAQAQVQQPVAQMQAQSQAQMVAQAVQQAIAQGLDPVQAVEQCMGKCQQAGGSEIDQMLADQGQIEPVADMDIQLDTPSMDVGEVQLSPDEDDTLRQLFSNNTEYKNAQEAAGQQDQDQGQQKQAHVVRTASMRTVGTRPTAGVSQIGGTSASSNAGAGRDLSTIWNSAPDVSEAFGLRTNQ
jgi:hypothetical protein